MRSGAPSPARATSSPSSSTSSPAPCSGRARSTIWTPGRRRRAAGRVTPVCVAVALAFAAAAATAQEPDRNAASTALEAVRTGGVIAVCRHQATDDTREREPVDYDDPSTQRLLSAEGERRSREVGQAVRALGVDPVQVVASPMDRALRTARLMFGEPVEIDPDWHTNGSDYQGPARARRLADLSRVHGAGTRFVISHIGTMRSVLPSARGVEEGDCVVVRPTGDGFEELGRVPWRAWIGAAASGRRP